MDDLEQAVRYALEPLIPHGGFELCLHCGTIALILTDHVCRLGAVEWPGLEGRDGKARARSYAIE